MVNKKLLLLAVFLMSMVAISAASAAENTTDEISEVQRTRITWKSFRRMNLAHIRTIHSGHCKHG